MWIKRYLLCILVLLFVAGCSHTKPVPSSFDFDVGGNKVRAFGSLIGGGTGALDKIVSTTLEDGDIAIVGAGTYNTIYTYDDSSSATEAVPNVITPNDVPVTGRWLKIDSSAFTPVVGSTTDFATDFTGANLYGGTYIVTSDDGDLVIPSIEPGMHFKIIVLGAVEVVAEPSDTDNMILDGVTLDNNDSATSMSLAGDIIYFQYYDSNTWLATSNGWTDED